MWKVEIKKRDNIEGENLQKDILDLGVNIERCEVIQVYYLLGEPSKAQVQRISDELLADKVWEFHKITKSEKLKVESENSQITNYYEVEVACNPGVMDPVSASTLKGILDLGIKKIQRVKRAKKYLIWGSLSQEELELVCNKLLLNPTIQYRVQGSGFRVKNSKFRFLMSRIMWIF